MRSKLGHVYNLTHGLRTLSDTPLYSENTRMDSNYNNLDEFLIRTNVEYIR